MTHTNPTPLARADAILERRRGAESEQITITVSPPRVAQRWFAGSSPTPKPPRRRRSPARTPPEPTLRTATSVRRSP